MEHFPFHENQIECFVKTFKPGFLSKSIAWFLCNGDRSIQ